MTMSLRIRLALCASLSAPAVYAQIAPTVTIPFDGQKSISITYTPADGNKLKSTTVGVCVTDVKPSDCSSAKYAGDALSGDKSGKGKVDLTVAIKKGQWVIAHQDTVDAAGAQKGMLSEPVQATQMLPAVIKSSLSIPITLISGEAQAPNEKQCSEVDVYVCKSLSNSDVGTDCSDDVNKGMRMKLIPSSPGSSDFAVVAQNGIFAANLEIPVSSAMYIWLASACKKGGDVVAHWSGDSTTGAFTSASIKPVIDQPLNDGDRAVSGYATKSASGEKIKVHLLLRPANADAKADPSPVGYDVEVSADGRFSIPYDLNDGDAVQVSQSSANPLTPIAAADTKSDLVVVGKPENERVDINFTAGVLLSQSNNSFSQANLFMGVNIDDTLRLPGIYPDTVFACKDGGGRAGPTDAPERCSRNHRPAVNGFFSVRLTAIPVNSSQTTTSTDSSNPSQTTYETFLASRKTVHFEVGLYTPWYFGRVGMNSSRRQAFLFAPAARFGLNTLLGNENQSTSAGGATQTTVASSNADNKVYSFWTVGARIGVSDLKAGAPRLVHYLDVGIGKFSNLRSLYCPISVATNCVNSTTNAFDPALEYHYTPFRVFLEGAIDYKGFVLGFSLNKSQNALLAERPSKTRPSTDPRAAITAADDDTRFLMGYRLDLDKLARAVRGKGLQ